MPPMSPNLQRRVEYSIALIRSAEKLALAYQDSGFHLAFSGGKDSQVIYHLALMAGVKFTAHMQMTSVDPPQLLKFIRKNYPDVVLHPPRESMYKLIVRKKCLPLRQIRYCCEKLKEHAGSGTVTIIGIRAAESSRRANRKELTKNYNVIDQFNIDQEQLITCVKGKDKVLLSPILKWSQSNVWEFIRVLNLPYCELYDMGFHRIGCIFCPMASVREKQKERLLFPGIEKAYKNAIRTIIDNNRYTSDLGGDVDLIFEWWISNKSIAEFKGDQNQLKLLI